MKMLYDLNKLRQLNATINTTEANHMGALSMMLSFHENISNLIKEYQV